MEMLRMKIKLDLYQERREDRWWDRCLLPEQRRPDVEVRGLYGVRKEERASANFEPRLELLGIEYHDEKSRNLGIGRRDRHVGLAVSVPYPATSKQENKWRGSAIGAIIVTHIHTTLMSRAGWWPGVRRIPGHRWQPHDGLLEVPISDIRILQTLRCCKLVNLAQHVPYSTSYVPPVFAGHGWYCSYHYQKWKYSQREM